MEDTLEEKKYFKIAGGLIKLSWKPALLVIGILTAVVMSFGSELSLILLLFLIVLLTIFVVLFISMIHSAINAIKVKNEQITPSISKLFEEIPEDVILENHEELNDIENLNGDFNYTSKLKLVSLSNSKIDHWQHLFICPSLQENINLKAYINNNGEVVKKPSLEIEPYLKGKDTQASRIFFPKAPEIDFTIEYSQNRIFPEMLTAGEWVETEFPRQVKRYKIEIKLPMEIRKIERCCITKKASGGGIIENGCYSMDDGKLVPLPETCYPHNQLEKEININNEEERWKIVLKSESSLNKGDSVHIWWLCS